MNNAMENQNGRVETQARESSFSAQINNNKILADSRKELVRGCLQEIYNKFKDLPVDERKQAYVDYFVKTFSYDDNLRIDTLAEDREPTFELSEQELANLFITKKGVCNQFAQALSLLSCFDPEFDIFYSYCRVYIAKDNETDGHAINCIMHNGQARIIDISSAIHCKERQYAQNQESDFKFLLFEDYIKNLSKDGVFYATISDDESKYILGGIKYFKDFDSNYFLLNQPSDVLNTGFAYNLWTIKKEDVESNAMDDMEIEDTCATD